MSSEYTGQRNQKNLYRTLNSINFCDKLPNCLIQFDQERSVKDKMDYNQYVLGKPPVLAPPSANSGWGVMGNRTCN